MAGIVLLEARPYRPFKSSEEYLYAMKEDLAEWLNMLYSELEINVENFMDKLETGVILCKHANSVRKSAEEYVARKQLRRMNSSQTLTASIMTKTALPIMKMGEINYKLYAKPGTFFARDNVSNFIDFCRHGLEIIECLLFETDDLIMRKNEKNVILCLLEVARRGAKFGMPAPILVQMEREIDREIAAEQRLTRGTSMEEDSSDDEENCVPYGPTLQIVTNDLKSLDEMVRDLVEKCTCPTQFPMIRVSEGKYRIGDTKVLIFVRFLVGLPLLPIYDQEILRNHVMVRVGGGWDTLSHYLDKHDPCRCRSGHRAALSSKLILKNTGAIELNNAQVHYERSPPRTRRSSASSSSSGHGGRETRDLLTANHFDGNRSRSPTPKRDNAKSSLYPQKYISTFHFDGNSGQRSVSPIGRGRSSSPRVHRPTYDAPTAASRNRSRSPSVRPENAKKSNADVTSRVSTKQSEIKLLTATDMPDAELGNLQKARVVVEANESTNTQDDFKQNDSESEVSDEGYRSLGLIITSPLIGEGKIVANGNKTAKNSSKSSSAKNLDKSSSAEDSAHVESPTSAYSSASNDECNQQRIAEVNGLSSKENMPVNENQSLTKENISREPSPEKTSDADKMKMPKNSPQRRRSEDRSLLQSPSRRKSNAEDNFTSSRYLNKDGNRKMARSRSACSREPPSSETSPIKRNIKYATNADKCGTWNGKTKKRSDLTPDTFVPLSPQFVRKGAGRSSLGAGKTTYDPATGRRIQKPAQEKNMSPLLTDLLKTKNLDDDKIILLKMKEIIDRYSDIFNSSADKKYDSSSEDLDFTTEWVRNNGSIKRIDSDSDERCSPSKRKDSKYVGGNSKIPAPVFYKQQATEKEY